MAARASSMMASGPRATLVSEGIKAAISQRTRDIGVLRIVGYGRLHILVSFFVEALLLAVIGGALGCLAGSIKKDKGKAPVQWKAASSASD